MLIGNLTLLVAALFAGAAIYINVAEQPARLALAEPAMVTQWQRSYQRAAVMQGGLALLGTVLGVMAYFEDGQEMWLLGALILLSAWPFTLFVLKPTNNALNAALPASGGAEMRGLIEKWGRLHAVRSGIGALATLVFLLAAS
jgi:hypothetical protein